MKRLIILAVALLLAVPAFAVQVELEEEAGIIGGKMQGDLDMNGKNITNGADATFSGTVSATTGSITTVSSTNIGSTNIEANKLDITGNTVSGSVYTNNVTVSGSTAQLFKIDASNDQIKIGSDKLVICQTFTSAGINAAIDALGTTGGEVYLPEGDYDCTATITIDANNTTLRGAGKGTRLLATNRTTFASYTGTPAAGETLTGVTSTYTAVIEKINLTNKIVWYHTISNATNFTTGETLNCSGGGTLVNIAAVTEQSFHAITTNAKTYCTIRDLAIVGGSGGGNAANLIGNADAAHYLTVRDCWISKSDQYAFYTTGTDNVLLNNFIDDPDEQGIIIGAARSTIIGNTLTTCGAASIRLSSASYHRCTDNYIANSAGDSISVGNGTNITVANNIIFTSATDAIEATCTYSTFTGNTINATTTGYADIKLTSDYNSIIGNNCYSGGTSDKGIWLDEADYCTVVGNVTLGHDVAGIQIDSDCQNTSLSMNNCSDTTPYVHNGTNTAAVIPDTGITPSTVIPGILINGGGTFIASDGVYVKQ